MWRDRVFGWLATLALALLVLGAFVVLPMPPSKAWRAFYWVTGGRPMKRLERPPAFISNHPDAQLAYWHDAYGRAWLAARAWSQFRIRVAEYDAR